MQKKALALLEWVIPVSLVGTIIVSLGWTLVFG